MIETVYRIPGAPRLALLGDFHSGDPEPVLASLKARRPDLICIAGDVVYAKPPDDGMLITAAQAGVLPLLEGCAALAPTFMSLGNHELVLTAGDLELIRATGATLLDNRWTQCGSLTIGGLSSHYVRDRRAYLAAHPTDALYPDRKQAPDWEPIRQPETDWLEPVPAGYTVLLCHHPEYYPLIPRGVSLVLSAHAHGGQWRFFGHGLYAPGQGWWPKFTSGVHEGRLVVTRGLTNTARVPRFNNPTELVYVEPEA